MAYAPLPQWRMVLKPDTLRGIQSYRSSLVLDIVFGAFALAVSITAMAISTSPAGPGQIAAAALLGAASCGLVLVFVINFIMSLISVMRMHHGVDEYGPEHAKFARRGVLFKWMGTMFSILATVLIVYILISGGGGGLLGPGSGPAPVGLYVPLLVTVFWTAGVSCKAQMYRHLVRALQPPETRSRSDFAAFLIPLLGLLGIVIVGVATARLVALLSGSGANLAGAAFLSEVIVGGIFLPPGLALIGYVIFFGVYGQTYRRLSEALQAPSVAPPMMAWMPPLAMATPIPAGTAPGTDPPCPGCGRPATRGYSFCPSCGTPAPGASLAGGGT